jgi:steroid delta-isomerase
VTSVDDVRANAARVRCFYERMTRADLGQLDEIYAANAYFRDPFNEVRGVPAIRAIFERMFDQVADSRFHVIDTLVDQGGAMMTWDMTFRFRRFRSDTPQKIHGATHLRFDSRGRAVYHRDYWDAAGELYAKLPLIGSLIRALERRIR